MKNFLGIEIGGSKLQFLVGDDEIKILERKRFNVEPAKGAGGIRQAIQDALPELLTKWSPAAIAVGFGGPVDWRTGAISRSHQIEGWSGFELGPWLQRLTSRPVLVDNDANMGALGEAMAGAGKGFNPVFYITLGSGVGGGLVVNGAIYHGAKPGESEIGHVRLDREGTIVEDRCSGWAVDRRIRKLVQEGDKGILAQLAKGSTGGEARFLAKALQARQVRNIEGYNKAVPAEEKLPYWVVVVDELADLMMVSAGEVQTSLVRLAQIARAVGIHLIIATQRPSVDVVTGLIKANFPTRIAFQVASKVDSRTVLDGNGAEQLLGRGDMIYVPPGANKQVRVHGAWVSDDEVKAICEFLRTQGTAIYEEIVLPTEPGSGEGGDAADRDDLYWDAVQLVIGQRQGSISFLQRRMRLGYPKAARFIDMMEQDRILGPGDGAKPREVLVGPEYLAKRGR